MSETKRKIQVYQIVFFILAIAVMVTIFIFSAQDATKSSQTSGTLTKVAVKIIDSNYDNEPPQKQQEIWDKASFIVRKTAHFSIYTFLGFCVSFAIGKRKAFTLKTLGGILFGFLYAASDEFHQHFVPGRSCEFRDMMIDTSGVILGTVISLILMRIVFRILNKRNCRE